MVRQLLNDQIENSRATMAKKMYDRQVSIITVAWKAQMIEEDGYVLKLARQVKLSDYFTITKFNQMPYWMMRASGCLYVGLLNLCDRNMAENERSLVYVLFHLNYKVFE
ncbi:hypothetical protein C5167_032788 [Papaver somniferum]|uniref:Uncharacterized protein n=1 Tax=Papaver somniferum TaxID=3469 RepID=A0A4Y7K5I8_PAPSO|nr:hypothetical protein C5167_032788 [Papaver somniferum]